MKESRISVMYRYRSYSLILRNYVCITKDEKLSYEVMKNEFLCGKSSVFPICLHSMLLIWEMEGKQKQERMIWEQAVYYMADLYYFQREKELFAQFLREERGLHILD